jgi:hypothetical protein
MFIAGLLGVEIKPPAKDNENQLRKYQMQLRKNGIHWVREPRWSMLRHDLAIIDFRMAVQKSIDQLRGFTLHKWVPESTFRTDTDKITYTLQGGDGNVRTTEKGVCPDAYFEIVNQERRAKNEPHKIRLLLELDMATHDNPSFGREKVAPGVAYLWSKQYKNRFGGNGGRWLVVTGGGERRLKNMVDQIRKQAGGYAHLFLLTTLDSVLNSDPFIDPIWRQASKDNALFLLS